MMKLVDLRAVIFDLDGTLLDTLDDLADAGNAMLEGRGLPTYSPEEYKQFIGDGSATLVERALREGGQEPTPERIREALEDFLAEYENRWDAKTLPYEGITDVLDALTEARIPFGVLSNKRHHFTVQCVEGYFNDWKWSLILGQRDGVPKKPDPTGALEIADAMRIDPQRIAFVGDSNIDIQTALAAGMNAVGASWGFRGEAELAAAGADALLDMPLELLDLFGLSAGAH